MLLSSPAATAMAMAMAARRGGWHSASLHYSALATGFYRAVPPPLYDLFPCANMSRLLAPHKLQRHLYSSAYPSSLSHDDPARHSSPVHVANTPPTDKSVTTTTATAATAATASDARERARAAIIAREQASPMAAAAAAASSPHLRDRHARQHTYLRISLTERCNLRCLYCMPLEGVPLTPNESLLTAPEVERLARLFVSQGVTKIRLTGGEPTIRKDLPDVISGLAALRSMGLKQIGITTNGLTIPRHINHLVASGLTHLNVSLDTLDPFKFELMTRRPAKGIHKVLSGIETALALGVPQVKINVVVVRGLNDGQDVLDFVKWVKHRKVIVRFIEYMPFDGNRWRPEKLVPYNDLLGKITSHFGPLEKVGDDPNDTSKHWRVPGHQGSIGFITSMTDHFCGTCNRLRITADGNLKVCLFGNSEVSLRDAMRHGLHGSESPASNNELLHIVGAAVKRKHARHAGMADPVELAKGHVPRLRVDVGARTTVPSARSRRPCVTPQFLNAPIGGSLSQSARAYSNDKGPWASLDEAADASSATSKNSEMTHSISSLPSHEAQQIRSKAESWSAYMGTVEDGDDSPWASLDAFVDHSDTGWRFTGSTRTQELEQPTDTPEHMTPHRVQSEKSAASNGMDDWDATAIAAAEAYAASEAHKGAASPASLTDAPRQQHMQLPASRPMGMDDWDAAAVTAAEKYAAGGEASLERTVRAQPQLTHVDPHDNTRAAMVDVSEKAATKRTAEASCRVYVDDTVLALIEGSSGKHGTGELLPKAPESARFKGPVLPTAQLAGIMGAKRTSELIPLCHGLDLSHVDVRLHVVRAQLRDNGVSITPEPQNYIQVTCTATTSGQTGVEMEALTGASIASLTLWDMLKSVGGQTMRIDGLVVSRKTGGKSGGFVRQTS